MESFGVNPNEIDALLADRSGEAAPRSRLTECESMRETLDLLSDDEAIADLRRSRADFAAGDTFSADEVRAELERRRSRVT
ncbi:hypothetical protein O7627_27885 [Solwaraspora sp. WMMD1047]|uniref:hypothetical protein n=1 Tax=Solwaraspora sp. WMMD1047 TaxID=3016102 RepID=UPI0024180C52|nr:hypothetical protein [Solwaraspora sp. WMMD1047]MDG4833098.1 hypothetical protein [Solwaraspora sp. WMMD1047]